MVVLRYRGVAQPGRASVLGAEGRKFNSCRPDYGYGYELGSRSIGRSLVFETSCCGFESRLPS